MRDLIFLSTHMETSVLLFRTGVWQLGWPIWSKVFKKRMSRLSLMSSIDKHSLELNVLDYQTDNLGVLTQLWDEIRVIASVERDGHFRPLHVFRGCWADWPDLTGSEFLLTFGLVWNESTEDVVDLLACFRKVVLRVIYLLFLLGLIG
jgi:hypothetical protein